MHRPATPPVRAFNRLQSRAWRPGGVSKLHVRDPREQPDEAGIAAAGPLTAREGPEGEQDFANWLAKRAPMDRDTHAWRPGGNRHGWEPGNQVCGSCPSCTDVAQANPISVTSSSSQSPRGWQALYVPCLGSSTSAPCMNARAC